MAWRGEEESPWRAKRDERHLIHLVMLAAMGNALSICCCSVPFAASIFQLSSVFLSVRTHWIREFRRQIHFFFPPSFSVDAHVFFKHQTWIILLFRSGNQNERGEIKIKIIKRHLKMLFLDMAVVKLRALRLCRNIASERAAALNARDWTSLLSVWRL